MVLILAGVVVLLLALVRALWYARHLKRKKARGSRVMPRGADPIAVLLAVLGALLAMAGILYTALPAREEAPPMTVPSTGNTEPGSTSAPTEQTPLPEDTAPPYGWKWENGAQVYILPDGSYATGWQEIDGRRYYFGTDGVMHTGWLEQDGTARYFRTDGSMATGQLSIHGVTRFFTSDGLPIQLVNPWHSVPADYSPDLVPLSTAYATEGCQVDISCYDDLIAMMNACNRATNNVCVVSGYRTQAYQAKLYENKVNYYLQQGLGREEAEVEAAKVVAVPGTSEHQLGLAVDIVDTTLWALDERQADLPGQQWLMEHCWEYGFILRYPEGSTDVTGIIYEPWHYRYVGKEVAKELHDSGMLLETYIQRLTH